MLQMKKSKLHWYRWRDQSYSAADEEIEAIVLQKKRSVLSIVEEISDADCETSAVDKEIGTPLSVADEENSAADKEIGTPFSVADEENSAVDKEIGTPFSVADEENSAADKEIGVADEDVTVSDEEIGADTHTKRSLLQT